MTGLSQLASWASRPVAAPPRAAVDVGHCELCPVGLAEDHRHLLSLSERRILCVCETCWSVRSGDADFRPAGSRTLWLEQLDLPDELWRRLAIPVNLAFILRSGSQDGAPVAQYPSPFGATECAVDPDAWAALCAANPVVERLEPDAEALLIDRLTRPPRYAIAPIDQCYRLVGVVKARWEGLSGGPRVEAAVHAFFDELRARAVPA